MYGAAGRDIKLYASSETNSRWNIKRIDMSKALTLNYNAQLEGGYEQNYKIGHLAITIDGITSALLLTKEEVREASSRICYLPEGAKFSITVGQMCHGWTMNINGESSIATQSLPKGGITATVNINVDSINRDTNTSTTRLAPMVTLTVSQPSPLPPMVMFLPLTTTVPAVTILAMER